MNKSHQALTPRTVSWRTDRLGAGLVALVLVALTSPGAANAGLIEKTKLTASDGQAGDGFGASVAISGDIVVVGAPNAVVEGSSGHGKAYAFVRTGTSWSEHKLTLDDPSTLQGQFGASVAISGDHIVVGSLLEGAYLFVRNGTEWVQQAKLVAFDPQQAGGQFANSVAIFGNDILVGAPRAFNPNALVSSGAVYGFSSPEGVTPGFPFFPEDGNADDVFGLSVALNEVFGSVVGAAEHRDEGFGEGAVYLPGDGKLHVENGAFFGEQLAVSGKTLLVAGGAVFVFVRDDPGLPSRLEATLTAAEYFANAFLQVNVIALSGNTAAVVGQKGGIFLYTRNGTTWTPEHPEQATLTPSDGLPFETVAVDGDTLVAGAPASFVAGAVGAVHVFGPASACELTCPADIAVCNDLGVCGAVVTYPPPTTRGNCDPVKCAPASGSLFPIGTTKVVCSGAGEATCSFSVTVDNCANKCPLGQGYWKNHADAWPDDSLVLGNLSYNQARLLTILNTAPGIGTRANASLILADQLIAAKLNLLNGADPCPIAASIALADRLIGSNVIPMGITPNSVLGQRMMALAVTLNDFNNGLRSVGCTP